MVTARQSGQVAAAVPLAVLLAAHLAPWRCWPQTRNAFYVVRSPGWPPLAGPWLAAQPWPHAMHSVGTTTHVIAALLSPLS